MRAAAIQFTIDAGGGATMRMIAPRLGDDPRYIVVAEEQHEFQSVTAALVAHPGYPVRPDTGINTHVVAYLPNAEELAALQRGEPIYLHLLTGGYGVQPHIVSVGDDATRRMYGLSAPPQGGPTNG